MRVIAGTFRSRLLAAPPGTDTRPTGDRLRESLFNILEARLMVRGGFRGLAVADLFAGTGALGIECLSRGAAHCFFAESAPPALAVLRANLQKLAIASSVGSVEARGTKALLDRLPAAKLDLVFLDPPYTAEDAYTSTLGRLPPLLAPGALVVAEFASRGFQPAEQYGPLRKTRTYAQGRSSLAFYEVVS